MTTALYEITLSDGRIFRVFCANNTQNNKFITMYHNIKDSGKTFKTVSCGIHTFSQITKFNL